ncbi:MAG: protein kinase domain-containing protein [Myxococcota bacterium]
MDCLSEQRLAAHLERTLSDAEAEAVEAHLDTCDDCRRLVARAVKAGATTAHPEGIEPGGPLPVRFLPQGTTIGRFVVLERLGAGAMGVVYAAYDPQLDRRVALKFLFEQSAGQPPVEARALARLSHPNVTTVHDVGVYGGHPYLAMEFVPGVTLAVWRRTSPSLEQRLELLRQAARGLEAAHRAGLAHRDFKPANVLVADGRAWVTDFGLGGPPRGGDDALAGTPAYMAPEQLAGRWGDALSDQYSFAVTAWEVLFGRRPFEAASLAALQREQRQPLVAPARTGVPPRIVEALTRALSPEPAARFGSMSELLRVLELRERRWRGPALLATAGVALTLSLVTLRAREDACAAADAGVAELWSAPVAQRAHAAFLASPLAPTDDEARLTDDVVAYQQRLSRGYRDACERFTARHEDEALYARRRSCLRQRAAALETVVASLLRPEGWSAETGGRVAGALPSVQDCLRAGELQLPLLPDDPARREEVLRLRETFSRFEARWSLQDYGALEELSGFVAEVRHAQFPPLLADVLRMQGRWQFVRAQYDAARVTLLEAAAVALASGNDTATITAWNTLATLDATRLGQLDEAELVQSLALAMSQRAGIEEGIRAQTLFRLGVLRRAQGRLAEAAAALEDSLRLGRVDQHPGVMAGAVTTLAIVEREQGFPERAAARLFAQLDQLERAHDYGPARGSDTWFELGRTLAVLGRVDEAREALGRAHAAYLAIHGAEHPVTKDCADALRRLDPP